MTTAIVELLVRSTVLFGLAGVAALLLRRRSASVQAFALTVALAAGLALPAMAWMPAWEVAVLEPAAVAPVSPPVPFAGTSDSLALKGPMRVEEVSSAREAGEERLPSVATPREPVVDREFTFDQAPAAYQALADARHVGKLVITS